MKNIQITIEGEVTKKGFRWGAMEVAYKLGIRGFAKYTKSKAVVIQAEGEEEALISFIQWCEKGPVWAKVTNIHVVEGTYQGYTSFDIL